MAKEELLYFEQESNVLHLDGLRNRETGDYLNGLEEGKVTVEVEDKDGAPLTAQPVALSYKNDNQGGYRAVLELPLVRGRFYLAKVKVDGGAGLKGYREVPLVVRVRGVA